MDQFAVAEIRQPLGIGGYEYAIISQKVDSDYWWFIQVYRTISSFPSLLPGIGVEKATTMANCDQQVTLRAMCKHFGCVVRHPPLGQPRHNLVVERKAGVAFQGICCCLASCGMPNVFWPMVGHVIVDNYTLFHLDSEGLCSYVKVFGEVNSELYIPDELVFFKSAPTIVSYRVANEG